MYIRVVCSIFFLFSLPPSHVIPTPVNCKNLHRASKSTTALTCDDECIKDRSVNDFQSMYVSRSPHRCNTLSGHEPPTLAGITINLLTSRPMTNIRTISQFLTRRYPAVTSTISSPLTDFTHASSVDCRSVFVPNPPLLPSSLPESG
ncbi:hypothetical protein GGS21DRAFT_173630 [Xylaria nigripes]|nr:hypothetical protein GGS21DRAFT_173630 [Xylaria nigripes]